MTDDEQLRADIRRITTMLGETLVRNEGQELLDLVELVRGQAKTSSLEDLPELRALDLATTIRLVRAFTSYFHLANVTEQVHRGRAMLSVRAEDGGWVERAVERFLQAGVTPETLAAEVGRLAVRPVLTAHPTEAARRSILDKLRRIAALLDQLDSPARDRRLAEAVDLVWQTDELRLGRPDPLGPIVGDVDMAGGAGAGAAALGIDAGHVVAQSRLHHGRPDAALDGPGRTGGVDIGDLGHYGLRYRVGRLFARASGALA